MLSFLFALVALGVGIAASLAIFFVRADRRSTTDSQDRNALNIAIAEENRRAVAASTSPEVADEASSEIDAALLADILDDSQEPSRFKTRWPLICMAVLIPSIALCLYWFSWGSPGTLLLEDAAALLESDGGPPDEKAIVALLEDYVEIQSEDQKAWLSLMSFRWFQGDREAFLETHKQAELAGHVSAYGDSLRLLDAFGERRLDLTAYEQGVRKRLKEVQEDSAVVAMFEAIEHTAEGSFLDANRAWENILGQSDLFGLHQTAVLGQRASRQRLEPPELQKITVDVTLEQRFSDKRWLYVYARQDAKSAPLAVAKRLVGGQRRLQVTLDDSLTMQPTLLLSTANEVVVNARLSASADALAQEGDIVVSSESVRPVDQPRVRLSFGDKQRIAQVHLNADFEVSPTEVVFIIVRKRDVSAPPLAVRRVFGPLPSESIEISFADAMLPNANQFDPTNLEVLARWSESAMAQARPSDVSSAPIAFELGDTIELSLHAPESKKSE